MDCSNVFVEPRWGYWWGWQACGRPLGVFGWPWPAFAWPAWPAFGWLTGFVVVCGWRLGVGAGGGGAAAVAAAAAAAACGVAHYIHFR